MQTNDDPDLWEHKIEKPGIQEDPDILSGEAPLVATLLFGLVSALGPYTVSGNFPSDLYGPVDTRLAGTICADGPCIWGHADSNILPIKFRPRLGTRSKSLHTRKIEFGCVDFARVVI